MHTPHITFKTRLFNRKIPVTLQEGEEFGRGEKIFHFACFDDKGRGQPLPAENSAEHLNENRKI
jgi:hypothetical protein